MVYRAKSPHVGTAFSSVEILVTLFEKVLRVDSAHPDLDTRDKFLLSKGHGCSALYAMLAEKGFFAASELDRYCADGSHIPGHVTYRTLPGVESTGGSAGHGVPLATGLAFYHKTQGEQNRI